MQRNSNRETALTILEQMGGARRLRTMLGAQFSIISNGIGIRWPNRNSSKGNYVEIVYQPGTDSYDMTFYACPEKMKAVNPFVDPPTNKGRAVKKFDDIYFDQLVDLFEQQTGWYLRMGSQKTASLYSLRLLMQYMEPFRPFVKNFRKFVLDMEGWMDEFAYNHEPPFLAPTVLKEGNGSLVAEEIPATLNSPPDTVEVDYSYPGLVRSTAVYKGTLAVLSKQLLAYHLINVSDRKGFFLAWLDFFVSPNGKRFFLFLAEKITEQVADVEWWEGSVDEGWVSRKIEPKNDYISFKSFRIEEARQPDTKAVRNQRNYQIVVSAELLLSVEASLNTDEDLHQRYLEDKADAEMNERGYYASKVAARYLSTRG